MVIIEALSKDDAWERLSSLESKNNNLFDYCPCCGERWEYPYFESEKPTVNGEDISKAKKGLFLNHAYIHYMNGKIKEVHLK